MDAIKRDVMTTWIKLRNLDRARRSFTGFVQRHTCIKEGTRFDCSRFDGVRESIGLPDCSSDERELLGRYRRSVNLLLFSNHYSSELFCSTGVRSISRQGSEISSAHFTQQKSAFLRQNARSQRSILFNLDSTHAIGHL